MMRPLHWTVLAFILLLVAFALAGCTDRRDAPKGDYTPYVISNDKGGQVISAIADRQRLKDWNGPVIIKDYCASSCTIFTTLPKACLMPGSTYGFHAVTTAGVDLKIYNQMVGAFYRNGIRDMFDEKWSKSTKITKITAEEYVALDPETKLCS